MSNPNGLLTRNMSPEQARLLDQQLRDKQFQGQQYGGRTGGFMTAASGAIQGAAKAGQGLSGMLTGKRFVGANEQEAVQAQQVRLNEIAEEKAKEKAREEEETRRYNAEFGLKEKKSNQDTILFNQNRERNELVLKEAKDKLKRDGEFAVTVESLVSNMDGLSGAQKALITTMSPQKAIEYLENEERSRQDKFKANMVTEQVVSTYFPEGYATNSSSTGLSNRYLAAIAAYRKAGLTTQAEDLEKERKARVEQKLSVEQVEQSVKDKWDSNIGIQNLNKKIGASNQGLELIAQGGGLAELAAQISFFKVNDPDSVVKESEIELAAQASGLLSSIEAALGRGQGKGILSAQLRRELQDFFTLSGEIAVEAYNETVSEQKGRYAGRDLDVDFMFGGEKTLSVPGTAASSSNYSFDLNNITTEIKPEIKEALSNKFNELSLENKKELNGFYRTVANDPAGLAALQRKAIEKFGFDALGYKLHTGV